MRPCINPHRRSRPSLTTRTQLPRPFPSCPAAAALRKVKIRKRITEACKKVTLCPWCGAINGPVKRVPGAQAFKLIHDKYGRDYR
jgi:hypothetical protein